MATLGYTLSTLAVTSLNSLGTDAWACSAEFDNSSNLYHDVMVGGVIDMGASMTNGETIDIFVVARHSATNTDVGGAIDTQMTIADAAQTEGTDFTEENVYYFATVTCDAAGDGQHWGPLSVSTVFGGIAPPQYFGLLFHNNSANSLSASGHSVDTIGLKYS